MVVTHLQIGFEKFEALSYEGFWYKYQLAGDESYKQTSLVATNSRIIIKW